MSNKGIHMPSSDWMKGIELLNADFPISETDGDFQKLAFALDDDISKLLNPIAAHNSAICALVVEDLLRDCTIRVSNCLTIREKAHDIEVRAIADALAYQAQKKSISTERLIRAVLDPVQHQISSNAISASLTKPDAVSQRMDASYSSDPETWNKIKQYEDSAIDARDKALNLLKI